MSRVRTKAILRADSGDWLTGYDPYVIIAGRRLLASSTARTEEANTSLGGTLHNELVLRCDVITSSIRT